ncbi:MAG: histidine phosphatase family protein [Leptospiraceae bacterium]|nr:histidine phosphatase family protein [Leptospiraceae bacterium]
MVKHLYLVRHGETIYNSEGRVQGGGLDSPLTPNGKEQTQKLYSYLKSFDFQVDAIFSSPLGRAYETAQILNQTWNLPITKEDLLKEIDCGEFEGKLISNIDVEKLRRLRVDPNEKYPGGESVEDVRKRAELFLTKLKTMNLEAALIVSHGNFIRAFASAATGLSTNFAMRIYLENTGFSYFFWSGEYYRICQWNNTSHLSFVPKRIKVT